MSNTTNLDEQPVPKPTKLPMLVTLLMAILGAAGGFLAIQMGLLTSGSQRIQVAPPEVATTSGSKADFAYVPVDPLLVTLAGGSGTRHLRFRAQLEVASKHESDVVAVLPRVVDVLNSYLRALETSDLEAPAALVRLRGQMLRRVQIVTGREQVRDLLVMEFVLD
jgi:flagellar FliL protein